jgi:ribosomal-protein-alanine N-acetyltransferase
LSYSIRHVEASDAAGVYSLERECFPDPYPSQLLDTLMKTRRDFFFVAIECGRIIGYAVGTPRGREGHIDSLAVAPHCRRRGIGEALLSAVSRALVENGTREIHLEVRKGNKAAISFYESMGFTRSSELKHYYADGEDAWVLRRTMTSSPLADQ